MSIEAWIALVLMLASIIGLVVWLERPQQPTFRDIDLDRQWTEMQLEQLARESRARMYRAADDARREQRERGL